MEFGHIRLVIAGHVTIKVSILALPEGRVIHGSVKSSNDPTNGRSVVRCVDERLVALECVVKPV